MPTYPGAVTELTDPARALHEALVAVCPTWIRARVAALPFPEPAGLDDAIAKSQRWLDRELDALFSLPAGQQRRSPLELFQRAMRFPTELLAAVGAEQAGRDPATVSALPEDRFDLAPASSRDLGRDVWEAHIAWGVSKAKQLGARTVAAGPGAESGRASPRRPLALLVGGDLMTRSKIEPGAKAAGYDLVPVAGPDQLVEMVDNAAVLFVDLGHPEADDAIRRAAGRVRTVAFGHHVDDFALLRAGSLGADEVLPRSRFFRRLAEFFPTVA